MSAIVIIDYGMGNLRSVEKAVQALGYDAEISSDPQRIAEAPVLILPGVGAFRDAISALEESGIRDVLIRKARNGCPVLGICLGLQLLFSSSCEGGQYQGLDLIPGDIVRLETDFKIPHMGWNEITYDPGCPLFRGFKEKAFVYFVHSYAIPADNPSVTATCNYGMSFGAAVRSGNVFATQFHPEKSGKTGLRILNNFIEWSFEHVV